MTPRICIVRHRDYEPKLRREARALRDAGWTVDVICLAERGHRTIENDRGVRILRLPMRRERGGRFRYLLDYAAFFVVTALVLAVLEARHHYDVVQISTMPDFLAFAAIIPRLRGSTVAVFMQEPSPELAEITLGSARAVRAMAKVEQAVLRFADVSLTVTEQLKARYVERGADPSKINVVLNGPEPDELQLRGSVVRDADHFTLICHGSIEERYGHEDLLEAVRIARHEIPHIRLFITGSGSWAPALVRRVQDMGLSDAVHFLGHIPQEDLNALLARADLGVVPMRDTAYANLVHTNKMFEYLIVGTPVLATRLDAVAAYFSEDAIAFADPDQPKSIASEIVALYNDPERRAAMVRCGHGLLAVYGWPAQKQIYLDTYATL
jgi:glycosyltransferase involved in cell wall biosynthesis